jgi:hypothetical protein
MKKLLALLIFAGAAFAAPPTKALDWGTSTPDNATCGSGNYGQLFVDYSANSIFNCGSDGDWHAGVGGGADELGCTTGTSAPTTGTALTCYVRTDTTPLQLWVFVATDTPYLVGTIADVTIAGAVTLSEATANGSNFRRVTVPDALTADLTVRYPNSVPTANNVQCFPAPTADVAEFTWSTLDGCNGVVKGNLATKFVVHDTGGDDTYAGNPIGGAGYCPAALADGLTVEFVADTTNTGAATLDFCGLGALEITAALAGTDLTNGDLVVGKPYLLRYYDTGTDLWIVTLPGTSGGGSDGFSDWQKQTSAIVMDATDKTIYTTTVTAGAIAAGKCLEIDASATRTTVSGGTDYKLWVGATSFSLFATNTDSTRWRFRFLWCNDVGSTSAQQLSAWPISFGSAGASFVDIAAGTINTSSIDTTASVVVKLTANGSASNQVTGHLWRLAVQ